MKNTTKIQVGCSVGHWKCFLWKYIFFALQSMKQFTKTIHVWSSRDSRKKNISIHVGDLKVLEKKTIKTLKNIPHKNYINWMKVLIVYFCALQSLKQFIKIVHVGSSRDSRKNIFIHVLDLKVLEQKNPKRHWKIFLIKTTFIEWRSLSYFLKNYFFFFDFKILKKKLLKYSTRNQILLILRSIHSFL